MIVVPAGATLTIAPGQVIKGRAFYSDDLLVQGTLLAQGTQANPIIFTSERDDTVGGDTNNNADANAPYRGSWGRIDFAATGSGNIMDYVEVRYGGSGSTGQARSASSTRSAPMRTRVPSTDAPADLRISTPRGCCTSQPVSSSTRIVAR